jgi:hypothetical protein
MAPKTGISRRTYDQDDPDDEIDSRDDPSTQILKFLQGKLSPEDYTRVETILCNQEENGLVGDRALRATDPTSRAVQRMQDITAAEREVAPCVGAVLGQDSAAGVYTAALRAMGQNTVGLHPSAARSMFRALRHQGARPRVAMDSVTQQSYAARFPGVGALKLR